MSEAIRELGKMPTWLKPAIIDDLRNFAFDSFEDLFQNEMACMVSEAQENINAEVRGIKMFVNSERLGSKHANMMAGKPKPRKKWRASSRKFVQGGGTV